MELNEFAATVATTNVTVTTTSEEVAVSSPVIATPRDDAIVVVIAWAVLTTGTGTTTVTPRVRRGATISGTLVGEANAVTIGAAAGGNEQFHKIASEQQEDVASVQYSLTLQQAGATGNGTVLEAGIVVLVS